jgi:hypothetical protein
MTFSSSVSIVRAGETVVELARVHDGADFLSSELQTWKKYKIKLSLKFSVVYFSLTLTPRNGSFIK